MSAGTNGMQRTLDGIVVVDASRMLPGAVLARSLLDLGARVIKVESPGQGDAMRYIPPFVDGIGTGFACHYGGAESVELDFRAPADRARLQRLLASADVFVESFRPGTLGRWSLDPDALGRAHPRLIGCSLPGFVRPSDAGTTTGHDLNFVASSGLLERLRLHDVPAVQLADVTTGLLASAAIMAALFERTRTDRGRWIVQPLQAAAIPLLRWAYADLVASGRIGATEHLIGGGCAAYRTYVCGDGRGLAVGCLEPKFWAAFCAAVGRPDLEVGGLDPSPAGARVTQAMRDHLSTAPAAHWLGCIEGRDLPITLVRTLDEARGDQVFAGRLESEGTLGSAFFDGASSRGRAPRLGEHNEAILSALAEDDPGPGSS